MFPTTNGEVSPSMIRNVAKKRRLHSRLFRREKHLRKNRENHRDRGESRKLYQKVESKGFVSGIPTFKDEDENLVTDTQNVLQIWTEHFRSLLVSEGSKSDAITPLSSQSELGAAIARLKNNTAAGLKGLPAELLKAVDDELAMCIDQLMFGI